MLKECPIGRRLQASGQRSGLRHDVPPGDYVTLVVSDTGSGMAEDVQAHVFEPFFTTKEPGRGTGLGLATCYGIVRQAHGHILVYSEPGRGTTFRILLPVATESVSPRPGPRSRDSEPVGDEVVLLVEDDDEVRRLGKLGLESFGYEVLEAEGAARALELAENHRDDIEVVVTDVVMPVMSGPEIAKKLRRSLPRVPILFVSGYAETTMERQGLVDGDIELLPKPFTPSVLATRIRALLD